MPLEDGISAAQAPRYIRMRELPLADFHAGNWARSLGELLAQPRPSEVMQSDGAQVAARGIVDWRHNGIP